jgi:hypothetical protein
MNPITILVSPPGFDDVNAVLQSLGGTFAVTRNLQDSEIHLLGDQSFLAQFQHLFLNCHRFFRGPLDNRTITAIRHFVENGGGTLRV